MFRLIFGFFSFSADFADVVSRALNIPKWRLFNIRIEKAEVDKCQIAKFGIIGEGTNFLFDTFFCYLSYYSVLKP